MSLTNPSYLVDTTFSAKNISSAASVYAWTVAASVKAQILVAMTIAGNGDYVAYLTHQWLGAGNAYVLLPKTTGASASGETIVEFVTIPMQFKATDVVNVMVDGLAGDTSVAGVIRVVADNNSLLEATDVWASATRTLTQSAAAVAEAVSGSTITITRGDTLSAALTGLASNTGYVSIDFTVKKSPDDADNDAILRIRKNASGTDDGLLRLNGAALVSPVVATDGSITVASSTALTMALAARASDDLVPAAGYFYEIQIITASAVTTITSGVCNISADITRAIA
jgi:hypothetical protein